MSAESSTARVTSSTATERVKRFFEDRDWKFYCALVAGLTVAGVGACYLTSPPAPAKTPKTRKKKQDKGKADSAEEEPKSTVRFDELSVAQISALSKEEREAGAKDQKEKGNKAFNQKKYKEAKDFYTKAIQYKEDSVFYSNRAACYHNLGEHDRVIEDSDAALKLDRTYRKAMNRKAQALRAKGDLENALFCYLCVIVFDMDANNSEASKAMETLIQKISETKAQELAKSKKPRLPSPSFVTAYLDSFRQDRSPIPDISDADESGDAHYARARLALKNKDYNGCMEECEKAEALGCSAEYKARLHNLLGTFVFLKGNAEEALAFFSKSIEEDPNYVQSYVKRSSIYMEQGDIKSTLEQFEKAAQIDPKDPDIYYHRGQVNYIHGNYQQAVEDYEKSIELDKDFFYAHIQLGVAQYKLGNVDLTMDTFKKTLAAFPHSSDVRNFYGELLADQGKSEEAITMFDEAIELDTKNPLPYINKAMLLHTVKNDAEGAIDLCKAALDYNPESDTAVAALSQILLGQGKPEEALAYFEKAIDLARTKPELEHALSYVVATQCQVRLSKEYPEEARQLQESQRRP